MSLKIDFVERAERGEPVSELCREFGVSRTTGRKWLKRFRERGFDGLEDESRRPKATPLATAEDVVMAVIELRDRHPRWGPRKLEVLLRRRLGAAAPSERTIARILKRASRVRSRRRKRPANVVERAPQVLAEAPNDVWTVDFKGWWRAGDGRRCEPLTVRDAFSRYVLAVTLCSPTHDRVRSVFEQLFRRHGVPNHIQCDNGIPFVSVRSPGGLSALSAWWTSLGVALVRSRPGCPQDNGGHERMHRDVRADVQLLPADDTASQQRALDRWRQEFNHVRPHQALDGRTPAELYRVAEPRKPSPMAYTYPPHFDVLPVYANGNLRVRGVPLFFSMSLAGHHVALETVDAFRVRVWFHALDLGLLEVMPDVPDHCFLTQKRTDSPKTNFSKTKEARQRPHTNV